MENLYKVLKSKIVEIDSRDNLTIKKLKNYYSFKLKSNNVIRSFVDVYVQKEKIRLQVSSKLIKLDDYKDSENWLHESNENWTLGLRFYIKTEKDISYALYLIKQSYQTVHNKISKD